MSYIGNAPTTGHFPVDNFTSSGGSTYTLSQAPATLGAIEVSVEGILQPTTAYSLSGTILTLTGVPSGNTIFVRHLGETLVLPTVADASITSAKIGTGVIVAQSLATNAVNGTHIALGSDAAGDDMYYNGTDYVRLAKGTAGQVLKINSGATAPEWGADTAGAGLDTAQTFTKGQRGEITALTDGATITPDLNDSNNFSVTLGGNRTLANPSNCTAGQSGSIFITQDGTGSRTLAYGSYWDFAAGTAPTLTTTASAVDRIDYVVRTATSIHAVATLALS